MTKTKILALFACAAMLIGVPLSSCGGGGKTESGSAAASSRKAGSNASGEPDESGESAAGSAAPGESAASSNSPASGTTSRSSSKATSSKVGPYAPDAPVDMKGYEFVIASPWLKAESKDAAFSEQTFFMRKAEVEKAYNCKIKIISFYADQNGMTPKITAKEKIGDLVAMTTTMMIPAALSGQIVPLNTVGGLKLDDARWVEAYNRLTTLNGNVYGLSFYRPPEARACIFYNKDLLKNSGITEDPQQLALNGKWTFDKFRQMCITLTKDTNKDGTIDKFGLAVDNPDNAAFVLATANNAPAVKKGGDGKYAQNFTSQPFQDALNFYDNLVNSDKVVKIWDNYRTEENYNTDRFEDTLKLFGEGNAGFFMTDSWVGSQRLRAYSNRVNYGLLPVPKGANASSYQSHAPNGNFFSITSTNKDVAKTVTILNALAYPPKGYQGEDWWLEDMQAEYFGRADATSARIYKQIVDAATLDPGYGIASLSGGLTGIVRNTVLWGNGTVTSALKSSENAYNVAINGMLNRKK